MRQWMVDPRMMCRKHLLGEHVEHHMFIGALKKGISIKGYLQNNLLEPSSLLFRHDEIALEMICRGYNHQSDISTEDLEFVLFLPAVMYNHVIDKDKAREDLLSRCEDCRARAKKFIEEIVS